MPTDYTPNLNIALPYDGQQNAVTVIAQAILDLDDAVASAGSTRPHAIVTHNANQSVANATLTALAFNTEAADNNAIHDTATNNSRLTLNKVGLWLVHGSATFALNATGDRFLQIRVNGDANNRPGNNSRGGSATLSPGVEVTALVRASAVTDYVELMAYQNSGGALNVETSAAPTSPRFSAVWLSD